MKSDNGDQRIVEKDVQGCYHFNGDFHNAEDVKKALVNLAAEKDYKKLVENEQEAILAAFEEVFQHKSFTGRSGTFFAYEGLGSFYWHIVSKLLLAVQENIILAEKEGADPSVIGRLIEHYYEIRAGIGVNKSPDLYGAFPTDAYSHTPKYEGAQQPGMTGQVKEDIINRWAELGVIVENGRIRFEPTFLKKSEFLTQNGRFNYFDLVEKKQQISVPEGSLAFTYCQTPIIYSIHDELSITIRYEDGKEEKIEGNTLDLSISDSMFKREGKVKNIELFIPSSMLV